MAQFWTYLEPQRQFEEKALLPMFWLLWRLQIAKVAALLLMQLSRFIQRRSVFVDGGERHPGLNTRAVEFGFTWGPPFWGAISSLFYTFLGYPTWTLHKKKNMVRLWFCFVVTIRHDNPCPRTKPNRLGYTCCTLRSTIQRQAFLFGHCFWQPRILPHSHSLSIRWPHSMNSRMATVPRFSCVASECLSSFAMIVSWMFFFLTGREFFVDGNAAKVWTSSLTMMQFHKENGFFGMHMSKWYMHSLGLFVGRSSRQNGKKQKL